MSKPSLHICRIAATLLLTFGLAQFAFAINGPGLNWTRVRQITLSSPATTPSADFQIKVTLTTAIFGANYTNIKSDASDLRFYDANDNACSFYIDNWNDAAASNTVWVKVPVAGTGTLYMFYGYTGASAASNGDNTFIFFDNFPGSSLNATKWGSFKTSNGGEAITVSGTNLTLSCGTLASSSLTSGAQVIGKTSFNVSDGVIIENALSGTATNRCGGRGSMCGASDMLPTSTSFVRFDLDPSNKYAAEEIGQGGVFGFPARQGNGTSITSVNNYQPNGNSADGTIASGTTLATAYTGTNIYHYRNGTLLGTSNTTAPTGTLYPLLSSLRVPNCMGASNNTLIIDYIRIRKFLATGDPVTTFGSESSNNFSATTTQTNVVCNGQATGSATVTPVGGTSPYTYLWSNGQTGATATGLAAGTYSVTVTDNALFTAPASVTITQPATSVTTSVIKTDISCFNVGDGTITITANGGSGGYSYSIHNGIPASTYITGPGSNVFNGLPAGAYQIRAKDSNGCESKQVQ